ncbi:SDR family NAD(P)-dependent oxidoreductase, partial [Escherichia coli]|nr:SDR family NAD(P)-dependent oxidoreductase [Escherichia coli]
GKVDVLVNNAGILRDKTFLKMDEAMWDAVIAVHLKGTFLCSQAFVKQAITQGHGARIVNTTSVSGMMGNFGQANYAAAKAGIYGLTRTMSLELQKHRITVNALA